MTGRALLVALLGAVAIAAAPAAACTIRPPDTTAEGRAAEAERARQWQASLDRAEAVFVAVVGKTETFAVTSRPLRGTPPARIALSRSTCDPFWPSGARLVVYATRTEGRWRVLRAEPDAPAARAAVRRRG